MAGKTKYFVDTPHQVIDGNIVYASNLNSPLAAIATGLVTMSDDIQTGGSKYAVDTGAVNAYAVSINPPPDEYTEGLEIWLKTATTNTGPSTINVNSLGVVEIRRHGLEELSAGDISANYFTLLKYSSGYFQIVSASGRGELAADEAEAAAAIVVSYTGQAEASAVTAAAQAVIATTQAGISTAQAIVATTGGDVSTAQAVIATDAATSLTSALSDITQLEALVQGGSLGVGQTRQNVLLSRSRGVTYTNNTARPILVTVGYSGIGLVATSLHVDGGLANRKVVRSESTFGMLVTVSYVVPVGSSYVSSEDNNLAPTLWTELR